MVVALVIFYLRRRKLRKMANANDIRRRTSTSSSFTILPFQVERPETSSYIQQRLNMSKNPLQPKTMRNSSQHRHSIQQNNAPYQRSVPNSSVTRAVEFQDMVSSLQSSSTLNADDVGSQARLLPDDRSAGAGSSSNRPPPMRVIRDMSLNSQIRMEVENLRLEVDRMRMERNQIHPREVANGLDGAPPSYSSQVIE